jgi:hypothetical protein
MNQGINPINSPPPSKKITIHPVKLQHSDWQLHLFQRGRKIKSGHKKQFWRNQMPEAEIKRLMKHLGESINETLAESPRINERIQEIRDAGYEIFLVIEAKIGFSRKGMEENETNISPDEPVRLHITPDDAKFLKSLKISTEED